MKKFSLPNLRQSTQQSFYSYIFNGKSYRFKFTDCGNYILTDIYLVQDSENKYILKGSPIVTGTDLLSRVKNPELIQGKLFVKNKYGKDIEPDRSNFNTDFELVYYEVNETD